MIHSSSLLSSRVADKDFAESPRWLIAHGQREKALRVLNRLRAQVDVDAGHALLEVEAIEQAIEESKTADNGSWLDL